MLPRTAPDPLEVFLLGRVALADALAIQRRLVADRFERAGGALILCEHPPTISMGRSASRSHVRPDDDELVAMRLPVRWVDRPGGAVLHLPGQVAGYLVAPIDAQEAIGLVQRVLVGVLEEFGLAGRISDEGSGVFLGWSRVASIGVAQGRGVAYHGFTLNVGPHLAPFALLDEPGLGGRRLRQTSMEAQRQRPAPMPRVRESILRRIESELGLERRHVYTDHPTIRAKARPHDLVAAHLG